MLAAQSNLLTDLKSSYVNNIYSKTQKLIFIREGKESFSMIFAFKELSVLSSGSWWCYFTKNEQRFSNYDVNIFVQVSACVWAYV